MKRKAFLICVALAILAVSAFAQTGKEAQLRFLSLQVGVHPEAKWFEQTIATFNAENKGRIKIVVDGVAGDQAAWEKLRTDAAADTMPDLFMVKADRSEFNVLAQSGRVLDLKPFLAKDAVFKAKLTDTGSLATYTDASGHLLGIPYAKAFVGIYYNKELFKIAGVSRFPTTWDDFMKTCATLKKSGVAPISLMSGENAWCSMLMLANLIGTSDAGMKWLQASPDAQDFSAPVFVDAVAKLQVLLRDYTTADAIGAGYGVAANNFLQAKTAMIANGPWMIPSFSDPKSAPAGFEPKVSYALAPGSGVIAMENIAYGSGSKTADKQAAAFQFLKFLTRDDIYSAFLTQGGAAPCFKTDLSKVTYPRINKEFTPIAVAAKYKYTIFPNAVKPAVVDAMNQLLPELAAGRLTPVEFASKCADISEGN
jgi:raffinose/stachyose/melibiose transport system substrate-binding protein